MKDMKSILGNIPKKAERPANHERADMINQVLEFMGKEKSFKYWLGRTRHLTPSAIYEFIARAKAEGKNPQAYFNFLLKGSKLDYRQQ